MTTKAVHTVRPVVTLHDLVLDYIRTQAYFSTAQTLAQTQHPHNRHVALPSTATDADTDMGPGAGASSSKVGNGAAGSSGDIEMDLDDDTVPEGAHGAAGEVEGEGAAFTQDDLDAIERRRNIINHLLNGAIMRAVEALNTHFPSVLAEDPAHRDGISIPRGGSYSNGHGHSQGHGHGGLSGSHGTGAGAGSSTGSYLATSPSSLTRGSSLPGSYPRRTSNGFSHSLPGPSAPVHLPPLDPPHALPTFPHSTHPSHVRLNLSIQAFIESFRQLAPSSPSSPSSSIGSLTGGSSMHLPSGSGATLTNALTAAQGLHQEAKKLPAEDRAVYLQEIKDVGALFAYSDPETSILKGFLDQGRRIALAEQVNRAILHSEGRQTKSQLEQCTRRVSAMWAIMAERNIDPTPPWTAADGVQKEELALYLKGQGRWPFSIKDFARHTAL